MPNLGPPAPTASQRRDMRERAYEDGGRRLLVSFSGGRSSALVAWHYRHLAGASNVEFVFANTGQEDERTLDFVRECDERWSLNLRWIESVVDPTLGVGTSYRSVDHATAHRGGDLFAAMCAKFGLPNKPFPHCTRELKTRPITAYLRDIGWSTGTYDTAIGYRREEIVRVPKNYEARRLVYPLMDRGLSKRDVLAFWARQPFDLGIEEWEGNCLWCWKKSRPKLALMAARRPEAFDVPAMLEREYARCGAGYTGEPRRMFRGNATVGEVLATASEAPPADPDDAGGCGEACEPFQMELEMA